MPAVLNNAIDWLSRPYGVGALSGKPFGVIGVTPTPYGGKWAHEDARRSVKIAGAIVVEDVDVSQSSIDVDVLNDPAVRAKLETALRTLVDFDAQTVAA
jgi:NAD(P)H-dependent FMN reductase